MSCLHFPRSRINTVWHPCLQHVITVQPRRLKPHKPHSGKRARCAGKTWAWRTLHSCVPKSGGKQPLCHSPGSQLHFFQERGKAVNLPRLLEKLVEDNARIAPTMGEATCPRQDFEIYTREVPHLLQLPCKLRRDIRKIHQGSALSQLHNPQVVYCRINVALAL